MAGSIVCGVDDSVAAEGAARIARALADQLDVDVVFVRVMVAPGGAAQPDSRRRRAGADTTNPDVAGGIARFALGGGSSEFAGGIARFGLAPRGRES